MANKVRLRSGQVQLVKVRVDSGTVVEVGDMVWLDVDDAKPATSFAWNTNLVNTQGDFAGKFLGIAHEQSKSGDTAPISVDVGSNSVYEMDVNSATYEVGATLGPDQNGGNLQLMNQQLEVAVSTASIARAVEYKATASTTLRVSFATAYAAGSANVNSQMG